MSTQTHYRKAFKSPYLSSADIVEPTVLTISHVQLEMDQTKKTKDAFNTAFFTAKELRPGEPLKPMILNACNSKTMKQLTGSPFLEDWRNVPVTVYVDSNVRFGRDTVEGLRISTERPVVAKPATDKQIADIREFYNMKDSPMKPETKAWLDDSTPNFEQATNLLTALRAAQS